MEAYVKPLKLFDPKKDLAVNESFQIGSLMQTGNELDSLAGGNGGSAKENYGKEIANFKTNGPITAGLCHIVHNNLNYFIVANRQGRIYLLEYQNSAFKEIWSFNAGGEISRTPAYKDNILYFTTREGKICALPIVFPDAGADKKHSALEVLWNRTLTKGILTEPIATGRMLFIGALSGISCYEAYNAGGKPSIGKLLWEKPYRGIVSTPVNDGSTLFFGTEEREFIALEYGGTNSSQKWIFKANEAIRMKACLSRNNTVVMATIDGNLYCLQKNSGLSLWTYYVRAPIYGTIISHTINNQEFFFFGADTGEFYCIDAFGKLKWSFKSRGKIRSEPLIHNGVVYFGCGDNQFYAIDAHSGELRFNFATDGDILGLPIVVDDVIFLSSANSFVHAVQI